MQNMLDNSGDLRDVFAKRRTTMAAPALEES
jgi:hypothetical protein